MNTCPITTSRLIFRAPTVDDAASVFAIYGDPETNRYNPAGPLTDLGQAEAALARWLKHWAEHGFGQWAIATREAPECVIGFGGITLYKYNDVERINLGYRFAVSAWGQGYATELARAALQFGFVELDQPQVYGVVRPAHTASIKVLEKIGMRPIDELDDVPGQAPSLVFVATRAD
ncbi:GNAT family N-acetyltransferase [Pseudomonas sp. TH34]|jgi:RimJ/RimL family protein N-acetyltransferase|uniref:GNAT family N-acetyltransferase n=1 Tax=Pseudomonas yamanorum TaxID=515393 RepID=A0AAJ3H331_9PSED|nr:MULTISPECIES: GNAT family N-acetyltransferase [Pseudomonas]MBK5410710.1 GNAT family N-acetyltransferase [Pseudomonas sp. TH34]NVZ91040.1 GNAT family N-acetyltransferase [Pseudomonas yamanorum]NWD42691.1 GNAT family N-acetyltransferase [Pseudomonas yamanorum]